MLHFGLMRLQRADQHVGLHVGFFREGAFPRGFHTLGFGVQLRRPQAFNAALQLRKLPDAAGLHRFDFEPRQAVLEPVAEQRELLAFRQPHRLRRERAVAVEVPRGVEPELRRGAEQQQVEEAFRTQVGEQNLRRGERRFRRSRTGSPCSTRTRTRGGSSAV